MTWICPECNRQFSHENQPHSCIRRSVEDYLENFAYPVREICRTLFDEVEKMGEVQINAVQNAIIISARSTFLVLKPKAYWVDIEFLLDEEVREFPIFKTMRASKKRFAHFVRLESLHEVDEQLMNWLTISYLIFKKI